MSERTTETTRFLDRGVLAKTGIGFTVAAVVLYLFGSVIGWGSILGALADADLGWMAVACLSSGICLVVWAKSWDVILPRMGVEIPFQSIVPTYYAATFADYVTPFGKVGGGPFIAYVLSTDERASYEASLAGVLSADLLNLVPFFTFAGVGFVALVVGGDLPAAASALVTGLAVLAFLVPALIYLSYRQRDTVEGLVVGVSRPIASVTDRVDATSVRARTGEFYDRIDLISGDRRTLAYTLSFAYVGWVFFAFPLWLAARSLGVSVDPLLVLFIVPASTLAGVTPTPGGLGGVEAAVAALLVALAGLSVDVAAAVALLYRIASYWFVVFTGGIAALYEVYEY